MTTVKTVLVTASVILFAVGAWPLAIITITIFATLSFISSKTLKNENQELKAEVQRLRQELEAQKAVTAAIEKSESKREG